MYKSENYMTKMKSVLIMLISWSMLFTPLAYAQETAEANTQSTAATQSSPETSDTESDVNYEDADYCYQDGTNGTCEGALVYNCHLKTCVSKSDNDNYNMEYNKCGSDVQCREDLKDDAEAFTSHQTADPQQAKDEPLRYLNAAVNIGYGCALMGAGSLCESDGIGLSLAGAFIIAVSLMGVLSDKYPKKFKQYKKQLEELDKKDEKGWSHHMQLSALETEIEILKLMEQAAKEKIKHHKRISLMITIAGALAAICAALTLWGCPESNPCTFWVLGFSVVAFALEMQANKVASKAKSSASEARAKAQKIYDKLKKRYNNQYNPSNAQRMNMASAPANGSPSSNSIGAEDAGLSLDAVQDDKLKTIPKLDVKMGELGKNGQSFGKAIGYHEIQDGYNKTRETGNSKYINKALDNNAAKISKAARRIFEAASKSKSIKTNSKKAIDAFLNPNSKASRQFIGETLANGISPIQMALAYREAGGKGAQGDIQKSLAQTKQKGLAYDDNVKIDSKDYLKKLKAQLTNLETLVEADDGIMAMKNYDPTVNKNAVDQLNGEKNKEGKETIHPDSGLSLWKIITNRYNIIKLKKGF